MSCQPSVDMGSCRQDEFEPFPVKGWCVPFGSPTATVCEVSVITFGTWSSEKVPSTYYQELITLNKL